MCFKGELFGQIYLKLLLNASSSPEIQSLTGPLIIAVRKQDSDCSLILQIVYDHSRLHVLEGVTEVNLVLDLISSSVGHRTT